MRTCFGATGGKNTASPHGWPQVANIVPDISSGFGLTDRERMSKAGVPEAADLLFQLGFIKKPRNV